MAPTAEQIEKLSMLIERSARRRIAGAELDGGWVWIKNFSVPDRAGFDLAHRDKALPQVLSALDEVLRFWHPLVAAISWTRHIREGADLCRMIKADRLLTGLA